MFRFRTVAVIAMALSLLSSAAFAQGWEERMAGQAAKKLTLDFQETKLSEACDMVRRLTGLNIIIAPALLAENPVFSLQVHDMEAATVINWFTTMTESHADVLDQAIFITKQKPAGKGEKERAALLQLGAMKGLVLELPPEGFELTDADRIKIVLQIIDKETPKIVDYPGPELNLGGTSENPTSFFGATK